MQTYTRIEIIEICLLFYNYNAADRFLNIVSRIIGPTEFYGITVMMKWTPRGRNQTKNEHYLSFTCP